LENAKSVGLRTVYILTKRLAATVEVGNQNGTRFTTTFPLQPNQNNRIASRARALVG